MLSVTTLGMPRMEQMLDTITLDDSKRYMHHYNFPPFSTGETGRVGSPKRREIGHGALAERALVPVLPTSLEWPYTMRVVSDVLASNGSTSMASVCGSTLSLMDAGVPIKAPVAGIAMGLVYAEGKYTTLTDILGAEDAFGDMDFKVAGTEDFVTALQLDTKIEGIPADVLGKALLQAKEARLKILEVMKGAIAAPREDVRDTAPKIVSFEIPVDKIGEVIGPKGKVINTIQQETGADISVQDADGVGIVSIGSKDGAAVEEAQRRIELILDPPTAEVGAMYDGPRREHHEVRCVRQHPSGPRRSGAHLEARARQAHRPRRGRALARRRDRRARRRHRPERQAVALDRGRRARRRRRRSAAVGGESRERAPAFARRRASVMGAIRGGDRGGERAETASFEAFWDEQAQRGVRRPRPGRGTGPSPAGATAAATWWSAAAGGGGRSGGGGGRRRGPRR